MAQTDTSSMASQSLSDTCRVESCHSPVWATGLCSKHKRQEGRQRAAFIKVRPDEQWCPDFFVPDLKVKKGRNPRPSMVPLEIAAVTRGYDLAGNLDRLPIKPKTKHLPKEGGDSRVDTWGNAGKQANKTHRKNMAQQFKTVHYAERDRQVWLRGQGLPAPKLPRTCHVPSIPATSNPSGWGKSPGYGTRVGAYGADGKYRLFPQGLSKPCQCRACRASRKARA
jgi:hypothetical protein